MCTGVFIKALYEIAQIPINKRINNYCIFTQLTAAVRMKNYNYLQKYKTKQTMLKERCQAQEYIQYDSMCIKYKNR